MSKHIKNDQNISKNMRISKIYKTSRTNKADNLFRGAINGLARRAHHKYPNIPKNVNKYQQIIKCRKNATNIKKRSRNTKVKQGRRHLLEPPLFRHLGSRDQVGDKNVWVYA
jgi:hypothetical protein